MKNLLVFAIAFVWLFSLSTTAFAEAEKVTDTVILKSGRTIKGIVLSEKWDFVTGSRRIPTVTVQRIIHHDTPPDYKEALDLIEKKQYDNAVFKLKLANDAPRVRDWLKLYVDYQMAEIDWRQGNWDEARKKYREIDKKYKDHIFSRTTVWRIAQSLLYGGDYQNAEGAFEVIFKDNRFAKEALHWRAKYWKIYTLEVRENYLESYMQYLETARKVFSSLSKESRDAFFAQQPIPSAQKELVFLYVEMLYRGTVAQALAGRLSEAEKGFSDLKRKTNKSLKNIGILGLSICKIIALEDLDEIKGDSLEKLSLARLELARGLLFFADTDERRADILYWAGRASLLAKSQTQAAAYFNMVVERYPETMICRMCNKYLENIVVEEDDGLEK